MRIQEIMQRWPTQETAMTHLERVRWGGRPICPYCGSDRVGVHASKDKNLPRLQCHVCRRAFSATVGTIFHHTHLPLQTWFLALAIMLNAKKNVSNAQLGRDLGLPYKTVWSLALRIRGAMATDSKQAELFHGIVEMDECYIGGKPRKGNTGSGGQDASGKSRRGRGTDKMPVVGIVERNGRAVARAFDKGALTINALTVFHRKVVDIRSSIVMTDEYAGYNALRHYSQHCVINHKHAYAVGETHTNTVEGFWSLIKRAWYGQHHHYSRGCADFYLCETAFKYSNRRNPNVFGDILRHMAGAGV